MLWWMVIQAALRSLAGNKLRSFLATLGIIIGVGAVIAMLAVGAGARQAVLARITAMGSNLLVIRPGQSGSRGVTSGTHQSLTLADARALLESVPGIRQLAPVVGGTAQVKYMNRNTRTYVLGTAVTYPAIRDFKLASGRFFTELEAESRATVAVLGPVAATNLFAAEDPVGRVIKINGQNFHVVGVLAAKGDQGWFNPDDQIMVPYSTAMKRLFGVDYLREINLQAAEGVDLSVLQDAVTAVLRRRHRLAPEAPDDFSIRNQAELIETVTSVSRTFTLLLGSIACIALVVGGIGIMNVMLVTVTERTREIGIRKAIGAKDRDVLRQFLVESLVMSVLGGLLGVGAGIGAARLLGRFTEFAAVVELRSLLLALSFAVSVGVVFGYYPARRAAGLDPIEALRYE